jgi:hypothetical protein
MTVGNDVLVLRYGKRRRRLSLLLRVPSPPRSIHRLARIASPGRFGLV